MRLAKFWPSELFCEVVGSAVTCTAGTESGSEGVGVAVRESGEGQWREWSYNVYK